MGALLYPRDDGWRRPVGGRRWRLPLLVQHQFSQCRASLTVNSSSGSSIGRSDSPQTWNRPEAWAALGEDQIVGVWLLRMQITTS